MNTSNDQTARGSPIGIGWGVFIITLIALGVVILQSSAPSQASPLPQGPDTDTPTATATATPTPTSILGYFPIVFKNYQPPSTATPTGTATGVPTPTATGTITPNPTLTISVAPTEAKVYEKLTFTVKINNPGLAPALNAVLSDSFPTTLDMYTVTTTRGTFTKSAHSATVSIGTIMPGDNITVTLSVSVNSSATQTANLTNIVTLTYDPSRSKTASVTYRVVAGSGLPGTGELPLEPPTPSSPDWSMLFLSLAFGLAALFTFWYGFWAKANQREGGGRAMGIGLLLVMAAVAAGVTGAGWLRPAQANQPLAIIIDTATPEKLAGYEIAPAVPTDEDQPTYRFDTPEALSTLPSYPIPTPTFVSTAANEGDAPDTSAVVRLVIPALNVDTVVKYVPFDGESWLIAGLRQEIAWLGNSSWPGLGSNTALAGHVTVRGLGNGPFRYLDQLKPGDAITLYTEEKIYTYRVREQEIVGENDLWVTQPTEKAQLTLITCTDWSKDFQLYLKRLVVFADLEKAEPLSRLGSQ